jgi:succinate dehydrogenase / fumarate reductase iron-sulfur subunit
MCGCCFSDCVSRTFDKNFNGPASLAKIHRFVADPRDKDGAKRVHGLVEMGLWSCTHCFFCWSQCPRDVRPVASISDLRVLSLESLDPSQGARHVKAFTDSIKGTGMLNEAALYLRTLRWATVRDLDLILKMAIKGKAPSPFKRPIPRIEEVRLLFQLAKEAAR